jgi:hypothetical protein
MKLGMLAAAAAISFAGATGASAQVYLADPYVADSYVAGPVYAAPPVYPAPPVYVAPRAVIVGEPAYVVPPVGGYVQPRYSYTINSPRGLIYSGYREGGCTVDGYCY